jgi:hypothetical protein
MVAIYYNHFSHVAARTDLCLTYITMPQTSKKNTPSKFYDNLYKTIKSIKNYLPVREQFAWAKTSDILRTVAQ